jgi:hypothetical protein
MASTSSGDGRYSTTASSIGCTPLFLNAEPREHRGELAGEVARRIAAFELVDRQVVAVEVLLASIVVGARRASRRAARATRRPASARSAGIVFDVVVLALLGLAAPHERLHAR